MWRYSRPPLPVWKCDLLRTSPSISEPARPANQLFRHILFKPYLILPAALACPFYHYWHSFYQFSLRFGFHLHHRDFAQSTRKSIHSMQEGQVFFYCRNVLLLCFELYSIFLYSLSYITQTIIYFALRTANATSSTSSGISDYAGDWPQGGLGTHPWHCCGAASLPIHLCIAPGLLGLVWL